MQNELQMSPIGCFYGYTLPTITQTFWRTPNILFIIWCHKESNQYNKIIIISLECHLNDTLNSSQGHEDLLKGDEKYKGCMKYKIELSDVLKLL